MCYKISGKEAVENYKDTEFFAVGKDNLVKDEYYEARTLKSQINYYLKKNSLKIDTVAKRIDAEAKQISRYSAGDRHPDRMMVIRLAFGLGLNIEDTNRLLESAEYADLSMKRKEDTIILKYYDEILENVVKNDSGANLEYHMYIDNILEESGCKKLFNIKED